MITHARMDNPWTECLRQLIAGGGIKRQGWKMQDWKFHENC